MRTDLVGQDIGPVDVVISPKIVAQVAAVLGYDDPMHLDHHAARAAGFGDVLVPTGLVAPGDGLSESHEGDESQQALAALEIDFTRTLFAGTEVEYRRPVCGGERLRATSRVAEVSERPGSAGPMQFVVWETRYADEAGKPVMTTRLTFVERS